LKNKKILAAIFAFLFALTGCSGGSNKTTVINCEYPFKDEGDVMRYSFRFVNEEFAGMTVTLGSDFSDSGEDVYKETLEATEAVTRVQDNVAGVDASFESDDKNMTVSQTISVDISKYDISKDELELFGDMGLKDITEKYVLENYGSSGFEITKNGEKVE